MANKFELWKVMYCCIALHNFIRIEDNSLNRDIERELNLEEMTSCQSSNDLVLGGSEVNASYFKAKLFKDEIATKMWIDY
jgi:hypothetical protein